MLLKEYKCTRCGHKFDMEVFEEGEAETLLLPSAPLQCPDCASTYIEPVSVIRHIPR